MPSRNIAIRKEIYDRLSKERRAGESFSKVVLRLLNQRGPLEELWGAWGRAGRTDEKLVWRQLRALRSRGTRRP
ncbi:MAG: hypothetical protein L3K07_09090 [Thermoplasmata archaeon]|nr:hypothetical protein [Thermoplasmata archaeon]